MEKNEYSEWMKEHNHWAFGQVEVQNKKQKTKKNK